MPNKTEEYLALACKTADSFSRQWEHWAEFLITAARLYKYSYPDQLMIYAQRPDATACAEYDVWNNKMNRYVRCGSKGIALLDESGGYPRLHYVFDVSDTAPRRNALYPDLWQINESLKEPVRSMLAENYDVHSEVLVSSWRMWPENLCSPTGTTTAVTSSASLTARIFCRT